VDALPKAIADCLTAASGSSSSSPHC
jgi:hypothetical protein